VGPRFFSGTTFGALTRALDAAALRQEAIAANLANANTPGYRRRDVAFDALLDNQSGRLALKRSQARHLEAVGAGGARPAVVTDGSGAMRLDGNNVDPDAESARLAETEVTYAALTQAMASQLSHLRVAINGSGR
jgi:flagellar basal-body rod protein FlgB